MKIVSVQSFISWLNSRSFGAYLFGIVSLSILYTISSQIVINLPFGLVPISLQPLPLFLAALFCGRIALDAYVLYYLQGLAGLPVFSNFHGGIAHLAGPTGGYLIGFFFALILLVTLRPFLARSFILTLIGLCAASALVYACGLAQLTLFVPGERIYAVGLFPFLFGDFIKNCVVAALFYKAS